MPQSGQIVGILKNMLDEMDKELNGAISAEEEAKKNFAEMTTAKKAEIEAIITAIAPSVPVLVSTHDLPQARRLADRVLFFSDGRLAETARATTFFDGPADASARDFLRGHLL